MLRTATRVSKREEKPAPSERYERTADEALQAIAETQARLAAQQPETGQTFADRVRAALDRIYGRKDGG